MKMNWMTILAGKAFISSKPYIVLSSCTGRDLSNICSVNSCLFYVRKQSNFPIKEQISPSRAAARFGDSFFVRMDFVISFILPSGLLPSAK